MTCLQCSKSSEAIWKICEEQTEIRPSFTKNLGIHKISLWHIYVRSSKVQCFNLSIDLIHKTGLRYYWYDSQRSGCYLVHCKGRSSANNNYLNVCLLAAESCGYLLCYFWFKCISSHSLKLCGKKRPSQVFRISLFVFHNRKKVIYTRFAVTWGCVNDDRIKKKMCVLFLFEKEHTLIWCCTLQVETGTDFKYEVLNMNTHTITIWKKNNVYVRNMNSVEAKWSNIL